MGMPHSEEKCQREPNTAKKIPRFKSDPLCSSSGCCGGGSGGCSGGWQGGRCDWLDWAVDRVGPLEVGSDLGWFGAGRQLVQGRPEGQTNMTQIQKLSFREIFA